MKQKPLPVWGDDPPSLVLYALSEALQRGDLDVIEFSVNRYEGIGEGCVRIKYAVPDETPPGVEPG